jgi:signal transduction histidine kinase
MGRGEVRRIERWLATARVFLTISALFAIWIDPTQLGYTRWAYWLLGFYLVHGVVVMLLLRLRQQSTPSFRLLVHAADIVWPALISSFAAGQHNPFFLFFIFVLAAAAYRWGLWETWWTGVSAVLLLCLEALAVHWGVLSWVDGILLRHHLPGLGIDIAELGPKQLVMRSGYLIVMSLLLGYMAEQQKQLRAEKAVIARMLSMARVESLSGTLQQILGEILNMYGARRVLIASQETNSHRVFLGDLRAGATATSPMLLSETSTTDRQTYLYDSVADTSYVTRKNGSFEVLALDAAGVRLRNLSTDFLPRLWSVCEFRSLATVSFVFGQEWAGRIFLVDPWLTGDREEELRFLQELVRQVGPAVYNVYLVSRLRQRAGAVERARFARELHDGAVQSLIAMEMQVDVLRRQSATQSVPVTDELGRIQGLLREEVLKLRELMQQMKSMGVDAKKLANFLSDTVERFQRETGIAARFVSDASEINMPPQVCREVARIVQEGLVNIRKHSGAHHVLVRLGTRDSQWRLTVEDDGRGFPFAGRFSQAELEATGRGPLVIKERVRLIEGELTVESNPGQGSRLEISIPQKREAVYGQ